MDIKKGTPPPETKSESQNEEKTDQPQEILTAPTQPDLEKTTSYDLETEKQVQEEKDQKRLAEIRASLGIEQAPEYKGIKQHLQEYLGIEQEKAEKIELLKAKNLPEHYQSQLKYLNDKRLENITIAVIPDDVWAKGSQPSESSAEKQLILIKQSYFEAQENPDEIAWLCHELSHCQKFLDSESKEAYQKDMQTPAFEDLKTEHTYPNNLVEQSAFTKQFEYLKNKEKKRNEVLAMLKQYYEEEDFPFFNKLLDNIYK